MALTPVQKITQAADNAEAAANVLEQIVEGDNTTTVTTVGGRTHPSITKWYEDNFLPMQNFITSEADRATAQADISTDKAGEASTSASNASDSETAAQAAQTYAEEWANKNEDVLVSAAAGGDGSTEYSSKHHAKKSASSAANAATSESNAQSYESGAAGSASAAQDAQTYAEEWAINPEDVPVSAAAGGDGSTTFSAYHWSQKAGENVHSHANKAVLDAITDAGSGEIITSAERTKLAGIEEGATAGSTAAEITYDNTGSGLVATNVKAALDELDVAVNNIDDTEYVKNNVDNDIQANVRWLDGHQARFGTGSDLRIEHDGVNSLVKNFTGNLIVNTNVNGGQIKLEGNDAGGTLRNILTGEGDGGVLAYFQGSKKLETTTDGAVVTGQLTTTGDTIVHGNLTVNGTTTSVNSNEVNIGDNIIVLNADEAGSPTQNSGFEVERGTSNNVTFLWDEGADIWSFGNQKIGNVTDPTADNHVGDRGYNDARYSSVGHGHNLSNLSNDMWEITSTVPTDGTGKPAGYIWFVV